MKLRKHAPGAMLEFGAGLVGFGLACSSWAQQSAEAGASASGSVQLGEIIVTSQRREESMQRVPIAVTTLTSTQLDSKLLTNSTSLQAAVPGLAMPAVGGMLTPFLRGVGSQTSDPNNEPSVALYVDGVYIATPVGNLFSFNNIDRIEVLKGPQGTLFGRNATGGVIQLVTRDPQQEPEAEFSVGYGNHQTVTSSAYVTGGLGSSVAADVAAIYREMADGLGRNLVTGSETHKGREFAVRSKWLLAVGEATKAWVTLDYSKSQATTYDKQIPEGVVGIDGSGYPGRFNTNSDVDAFADTEIWGGALRFDHDLGNASLVSITAYRDTDRHFVWDSDAIPLRIVAADAVQLAKTFSQELQLLSPAESAVDWLIGGYFFDARYDYDPLRIEGEPFGPPPAFLDIVGRQDTKSYSAYGQATYEVAPRVRVTGGLRYTWEEQDLAGYYADNNGPFFVPGDQNQKVDEPTWRAAVDFQVSDDVLAYVSYNRGMKSGGFNIAAPELSGYQPEILDAYEIGLKNELFDRKLRLNIAAFYYDYQDIQVELLEQTTTNIVNAAAARIQGIDLDFEAILTENLSVSGGFSLLDGEFTDYKDALSRPASPGPRTIIDATGNDAINTPKFSGSGSVSYRIPSRASPFTLSGTVIRNDGYFVAADNRPKMPAYTLVNASISWMSPSEKFGAQLWAKNLTDEEYLAVLLTSGSGDTQVEADPRTYGVTISAKF